MAIRETIYRKIKRKTSLLNLLLFCMLKPWFGVSMPRHKAVIN